MPKIKIDYSNTIFYKIYCKDTSVNDLYIGHTTNFVQRKYGHKQSCINPKSANYNCKVYETIRDNMGWENWTMEIIAFHNCDDLMAAKRQEQHYFEEYNATLNCIEPSPPRKPKKEVVAKPKKKVLYCNTCKIFLDSQQAQIKHNKRPKHLKLVQQSETTSDEIPSKQEKPDKYSCEQCNFSCSNKKDYNRHLHTAKHIKMTNNDKNTSTLPLFVCECGNQYKYRQGLHYHKKTCNKLNQECTENITDSQSTQVAPVSPPVDSSLVIELLKQNQEFKAMMLEQNKRMSEQQDTIIELSKIIGTHTTINTNS